MKKILSTLVSLLIFFGCEAKVTVKNHTDKIIKVLVHFIGVGSPSEYLLKPGEEKTETKDLANIKKRYQVWLLEDYLLPTSSKKMSLEDIKKLPETVKKEYQASGKIPKERLVIDKKGLSDAGAFRFLDVYQEIEPESGEIIYGIYSHGT